MHHYDHRDVQKKVSSQLQARSLYYAVCWKKHIWEDSKYNCKISGIDGCRKVYRPLLTIYFCNLLADAGASKTTMKRHDGWKSTMVTEGYLEDSMTSKNDISKK